MAWCHLRAINEPTILEPDHDLALGEAELIGQLPSLFPAEERLLPEALLHLRQLRPREHRALRVAAVATMIARCRCRSDVIYDNP